MNRRAIFPELFLVFTAVGLVATFAAPWLELRGTYAAWRIVEWHTFWRGGLESIQPAFLLADVVAANVRVPVEYGTTAMQMTLRGVFVLGSALGVWHGLALVGLLILGTRMRLHAGLSRRRVAFEIAAIALVNLAALYSLAILLALPSSLTPKVDFRSAADIHTDSLIWSDLTILPIGPMFAILGVVGQFVALWNWMQIRHV